MAAHYDDYEAPRRPLSAILHALAFGALGLFLTLSPWLYASWEMWWFWPMVFVLMLSCLFSGSGLLLETLGTSGGYDDVPRLRSLPPRVFVALGFYALFLVYVLLRAQFPSAADRPSVDRETERSLLLFFTPVAIALVSCFSSTEKGRLRLVKVLLVNAALISIYGLINHAITNDTQILWAAGHDFAYTGRVSGSFFCPNNYSAFVGMFQCLLLAMVLIPRVKMWQRLLALLGFLALAVPNFLSLSRGGVGALCITLCILVPTLALRGHRRYLRILVAFLVLLFMGGAFLAIRYTDNPLMKRVELHPLWKSWVKSTTSQEFYKDFQYNFCYKFDRGTYIMSALRAWETSPVWGIGPGQHSNRWTEFAFVPDGVRYDPENPDAFKAPSRVYSNEFHLYEVHSDWTQLLEETGIIGFSLFLLATIVFYTLCYLRQSAALLLPPDKPLFARALPLAMLLILSLITIQSLFDFSLQIPAVTWTFSFFLASTILAERKIIRNCRQ